MAERKKAKLPPKEFPRQEDPYFPEDGLYYHSELRQVVGHKINPQSHHWYERKDLLIEENSPVRTCVHPQIEAWIGSVQGYDPHSKIIQKPIEEWPLSAIMPRLSPSGAGMSFPIPPLSYVIDYSELHSNPATLPSYEHYKKLIPQFLPEGSNPILGFFGGRALTVGLWNQPDFWAHPFLDQFEGVIVPDFSVYSDDPWPQSLLGERMHQIFAEEGCAQGRNVIPSIAWASEESLARQIDLYLSNPHINTIRFDCLGHNVDKLKWAWRGIFALEKYAKDLPNIRWIISGLTRGWHIRELNEIFPNKNYTLITPLSQYIKATRGTSSKEIMEAKFKAELQKIEDFRMGRVVSDPQPRPDEWPKIVPAVN